MRDVEELWRVWRHDSVRRTLQTGLSILLLYMTLSLSSSSGFGYTKDRIRAACWRRDQGRAPSAFMGYQSMFLAYRYTGSHTDDQPWQWVAEAGPVVPSGEVYYQYPYGDSAPLAQPNEAQYAQFTFTPNPAIAQQFYGLQQGVAPNTVHYPPPAYPPPHDYRSQQSPFPSVNTPPIPGSPPMSPAVAEAVEVATRFLEASNKAVNICIELNAM